MIDRELVTVWVAILLALAVPVRAAGPIPFQVIVNAANPTVAMPAEGLAGIFLKDVPNWPGGEPALPVDQSIVAATRRSFSSAIFGQSTSAIQSYWEQQMRLGRTPPPVKTSDEDVMAYVAGHAGAVGYVAADTRLATKVKILQVTANASEQQVSHARKDAR